MRIFLFALAAVFAAFLFSGCSSFNRDWRRVTAQPVPSGTLEGPWQGNWQSDQTGHSGKLRCLITKTADDSYAARFYAKFLKVLSFRYTVSLKTEHQNNQFTFQGEADLGKWGGFYHYEGHADAST